MGKSKRETRIDPTDIINIAINEVQIIKSSVDPKTNKHEHSEVFLKSDEKIEKLVKIAEKMVKK